jgi:hypothetical protein
MLPRLTNALVGSDDRYRCRMVSIRSNRHRRPGHWSGWSSNLGMSPLRYLCLYSLMFQTSLRRLPCFPAPTEPEPARAPQPAPLSATELAKLSIVCYIPKEDELSEKQEWDATRFPYPAHSLAADQAMCAICQENYTEPETVRRVLYQVDPLRLLGCGHVYHVSSPSTFNWS